MIRKPLAPRPSDQLNKIDANYPIKPKSPIEIKQQSNEIFQKKQITNESIASISQDRLLNEDDRVKVFLRMRKLLPGESAINFNIDNNHIVVHPLVRTRTSKFCVDKSFTFRQIFDEKANQLNVFENVALPLLPGFLDGKDILLFCYGSTNAGKTYTVCGNQDNPGLLQRSMEYIVSKIHENHGTHSQQLFVSFFEIYNEKIYDLLDINNNTKLFKLGMNDNGEMEVRGLKEIRVISHEDARNVIALADSGRHKGVTELNCDSSRSHTIFQVHLKKKDSTYAVFSVVDLAGSERLSSIRSQNGSFKEACNINKSMLVLGKCIRKLNEQSMSSNPSSIQVPYRESKLTHIFKNFFEPVCRPSKASIIINVSPCQIQYDDTLFSLQFAHEASMCSIRQIQKQVSSFDEDGGMDEIDMAINQIEKKIEAQIRSEMDEFLHKQEIEYIKRMKEISGRCSKQYVECSIEIKDSDQMLCYNNISELKQRIVLLSNENFKLRSLIQVNYDKIQTVTKENKQIIAKNQDLKHQLQSVSDKNKSIQQKIECYLGEKESPIITAKIEKSSEYDFSISATPKRSILLKGPSSDEYESKNTRKVVLVPSNV